MSASIISQVTPLVARAKEMRRADPIVAYYCLYLAVKKILESKEHNTDTRVANYVTQLLNELETMNQRDPGLQDPQTREILTDNDLSKEHVRQFAATVFTNAVKQLDAQNFSKQTANALLAASVFLDLERIWQEPETATLDQIKYCKYEAMQILKSANSNTSLPQRFETSLDGISEKSAENDTSSGVDATERNELGKNVISTANSDNKPKLNENSISKTANSMDPDADISASQNLARSVESEEADNSQMHVDPTSSSTIAQNVVSNDLKSTAPQPPPKLPAKQHDPSHSSLDTTVPSQTPYFSTNSVEKLSESGVSLPHPSNPDSQSSAGSKAVFNIDQSTPQSLNSQKAQTKAETAGNTNEPESVHSTPQFQQSEPSNRISAPFTRPSEPVTMKKLINVTAFAQKHTKYAMSALNYDDIPTAITELQNALDILKDYEKASGKSDGRL